MPPAVKQCSGCNTSVKPGESFAEILDGKYLHLRCFNCTKCSKPLPAEYTISNDNKLYHIECLESLNRQQCSKCSKDILATERAVKASGRPYHARCFACSSCIMPLMDKYYEEQGKLFCFDCYQDATCLRCKVCTKAIKINQQYTTLRNDKYHTECFPTCSDCHHSLVDGTRRYKEGGDGKFVCDQCNKTRVAATVPHSQQIRPEMHESNQSNSGVFEAFGKTYAVPDASRKQPAATIMNAVPVAAKEDAKAGNTKALLDRLQSTIASTGVQSVNVGAPTIVKPNIAQKPATVAMKPMPTSDKPPVMAGKKDVKEVPVISKQTAPPPPPAVEEVPLTSSKEGGMQRSKSNLSMSLLDQIRSSSMEKLNKVETMKDTSKPLFLRDGDSSTNDTQLRTSMSKSLSKMSLQDELQNKRAAMSPKSDHGSDGEW